MPKRPLPVDGVTPADQSEQAAKRDGRRGPRSPRISIPLKDDGDFDIASMRDGSKQRLIQALESDPSAFDHLKKGQGIAGQEVIKPTEGPVTPDHVNFLLNVYEFAERWGIPRYIEQTTEKQVKADQELANLAFKFSLEWRAHYAPIGAVWLNQVLPEWAKKWLAKGGPGVEFITAICFLTYMQTQAYIDMWKAKHQPGVTVEGEVQQPVNGRATV